MPEKLWSCCSPMLLCSNVLTCKNLFSDSQNYAFGTSFVSFCPKLCCASLDKRLHPFKNMPLGRSFIKNPWFGCRAWKQSQGTKTHNGTAISRMSNDGAASQTHKNRHFWRRDGLRLCWESGRDRVLLRCCPRSHNRSIRRIDRCCIHRVLRVLCGNAPPLEDFLV